MTEKKHHSNESFLKQIINFKYQLFAYAVARCKAVHPSTFEVQICDKYLVLRVEGEYEDGDSVAFKVEVEATGDEIYQRTLSAGTIVEEH